MEYSPENLSREGLTKYNLAVKLLNFAAAWNELVEVSTQLPDYDLTAAYPFGQLDFEGMAGAVDTWCRINAAEILDKCPIMVRNPQCLIQCGVWHKATLTVSNQCSERSKQCCLNYPLVPFDAQLINNAIKHLSMSAAINKPLYNPNIPEEVYDAYVEVIRQMNK